MMELKPCPFRIHGERRMSATMPGEYYYNESFMPCMRDRCACYMDTGEEIRCNRDHLYLVIGRRDDD